MRGTESGARRCGQRSSSATQSPELGSFQRTRSRLRSWNGVGTRGSRSSTSETGYHRPALRLGVRSLPLRCRRRGSEALRLHVVPEHREALEPLLEEERVSVHPRGAVPGGGRRGGRGAPLG